MGELMRYKVLLLTSGVGSRLGNITKYTNKSLVRVGKKPAISHIIERYPEDVEIVVTLGYYGDHVRDFLRLAYPNRPFTFVSVDNYDGPGSSLVYSILCAETAIDCPFIFQTCDTIVKSDPIPEPSYNWVGGSSGDNSTQYATITALNGNVLSINPKGEINFSSLYIGLAGIRDHSKFFSKAKELYAECGNDSQLSDIHVTPKMIQEGIQFTEVMFHTWLDIGNIDKLKEARKHFEGLGVLDKDTESIFVFDDKVIKFFYDEKIVANRVERAHALGHLVPRILGSAPNFYSYQYAHGLLLSSVVNEKTMKRFLQWSRDCLWKPIGKKNREFYRRCRKFYVEKTEKRIHQFLAQREIEDEEEIINGEVVPRVFDMLRLIPEKYLCDVPPYQFHGDYILDNVLWLPDGFTLLDWRQDFGGDTEAGDVYYDLAKLNHNLIFNHDIIGHGHYCVKKNGYVKVDLLVSRNLEVCRQVLEATVKDMGMDYQKVELLTAIVWLNMSPLHTYPLDVFLYYFGKYNLYRCLRSQGLLIQG
jgi:choline kinase